MSKDKPRLGFVGLGIMGVPMVKRLLDKEYEVAVWNLEPERAEAVTSAGAAWCEGPAEVRAAAEILLFCVLDGDAVEECCFGEKGIVRSRSGADILIDCSTISPERTRDLAQRLEAAAGMSWVDAPISGGPGPAEKGELTIMAGGNDSDFERVRPVLETLGANVMHMGPLGAGQATKNINQAIVGVNYVLMAEILALAKAAGIDANAVPDALRGGMADSVILQRIYSQMSRRDFEPPKAYARQLAKDLRSVRQFHSGLDLDLPLVDAAVDRYVAFVDAGNGMSDSAAIANFYERTSDDR